MRFMLLLYETALPLHAPTSGASSKTKTYDGALREAGVLLARDRLHPPAMGVRVSCPGGERRIAQGPRDEAEEVVTQYWLLEVRSRDEAIEWAIRCPVGDHESLEVREVHAKTDAPST